MLGCIIPSFVIWLHLSTLVLGLAPVDDPPPDSPPVGWDFKPRAAWQPSDLTLKIMLEKRCRDPRPGQCLFYTTSLSDQAQHFIKQRRNQLEHDVSETIWDIWPPMFYVTHDVPWNPLRDIMRLPPGTTPESYPFTDRREYFALMSRALAVLCSVKATVMTKDLDRIPHDGIWYQYELPTLMREVKGNNPQADWINIINEKGDVRHWYWRRTNDPGGQFNTDRSFPLGKSGDRGKSLTIFDDIDIPALKPNTHCACGYEWGAEDQGRF